MRPPPVPTLRARPDAAEPPPTLPAPAVPRRRARPRTKSPREALQVLRRYGLRAPVDVYGAARELGLGPVEDPDLPGHLCGLIERAGPGDWQIVVNRNHVLTRRRFAVAHAIGHFILHRDQLEAFGGASDTTAFRTDDLICPNPAIGPDEELEANSFAVDFLIPDRVLQTALSIGITDDEDLARGFNVLRAAMRIRLGLPPLPGGAAKRA